MLQGAGREDLTEADATSITLWPVSASFGRISASRTASTPLTITLTNLTGTDRTLTVTEKRFNLADGALGAAYGGGTVVTGDSRISTPSSVTVPANGTATLTVAWRPASHTAPASRAGSSSPVAARPTSSGTGRRSPRNRSFSSSPTRSPGHRPGLRHVRCRLVRVRTRDGRHP